MGRTDRLRIRSNVSVMLLDFAIRTHRLDRQRNAGSNQAQNRPVPVGRRRIDVRKRKHQEAPDAGSVAPTSAPAASKWKREHTGMDCGFWTAVQLGLWPSTPSDRPPTGAARCFSALLLFTVTHQAPCAGRRRRRHGARRTRRRDGRRRRDTLPPSSTTPLPRPPCTAATRVSELGGDAAPKTEEERRGTAPSPTGTLQASLDATKSKERFYRETINGALSNL